jgi:hypothetical protein
VSKELEIQHMNRKGYTSQNVMAICDFDLRFTFVVPGWPGSVHDTRVWSDARVEYVNYPHPPEGTYRGWINFTQVCSTIVKLLISN